MAPTIRLVLLRVVLCFGIIMPRHAASQPPDLPVPSGPGNLGTEFYFSFPANFYDPEGGASAIRVYITSAFSTTVSVYVGERLKSRFTTDPYVLHSTPLEIADAQAFIKELEAPVPPDRIYENKAIRVVADDPIVVYGMNRVPYSSDGFLALPVSGLGKKYIVASARSVFSEETRGIELPSQYMVIAPFDSTAVTITNSMSTPNHPAGTTFTIALNEGDVYSAMSTGADGDLSGSVITADKPIAVMAGQNCTFLPDGRYPACDHLVEMLPPVSAWGKTYHSVPYARRTKGDYYRIFSAEPNTTVRINGDPYEVLETAGGVEGAGWVVYLPALRHLNEIAADKPIMVAQYNTSQRYDGPSGVATDPFYSVLTPPEQYVMHAVVTVPPDFGENYLNVVSDSAGWSDVTITTLPGGTRRYLAEILASSPQAFSADGGSPGYVGATIGIEPGTYRIRSSRPFAAYLYGFGRFDSYGYPAAMRTADITGKDLLAPGITLSPFSRAGISEGRTVDPDEPDRSNLSTVSLDPNSSSNVRISSVGRLRPGLDTAHSFNITVIDNGLPARAVVVVFDMAGNVSRDTVIYDPALFDLAPPVIKHTLTGLQFNGTVTDRPDNAAVRTNLESVTFEEVENMMVSSAPFEAGVSPSTTFTATVTDASANAQAIVRATDAAGNVGLDTLRYTAPIPDAIVPTFTVTRRPGQGVFDGVVTDMPDDEAVRSNLASVALVNPTNLDITVAQFTPGIDRSTTFIVTVTDNLQNALGIVRATDVAGNFTDVAIEYSADPTVGAPDRPVTSHDLLLSLVPNPSQGDRVTLAWNQLREATVEIRITDVRGRELGRASTAMEAGARSFTLDLRDLPAGAYVGSIEIDGVVARAPFVIVR